MELDDVARELIFGAPQPEALGSDPAGRRAQAACRRRPRPLRGQPVRGSGQPAAARDQLVGGDRVRVTRVLCGDRRDVGGGERPEHDLRPAGRHRPGRRGEDERGRLGELLRQPGQLRRVGVVEHDQRAPAAPGEQRERDPRALTMRLAGQLGGQSRPATARRTDDDRDPTAARAGLLPRCSQQLELAIASEERRRGHQLRRELRGRRSGQRVVLAQHRRVELSQLRAGLHADLIDERRPRVPVRIERIRLAPGAIEREHQLRVQALTQRLAGDQRLELADELAMPSVGQIQVDHRFGGSEPELLQAPDRGRGERLVRDVGQRRSAPERERLARGALGDQTLEAARVDLVGRDPQLVAAAARNDRRPGVEHAAQMRYVLLDHLRRGRRRVLAPQPFHQLVGGYGTAGS